MGFTGKKALQWQLKYIQAFNQMEKQLRDQEQQKFTLATDAASKLSISQVVAMIGRDSLNFDERISALERKVNQPSTPRIVSTDDVAELVKDIAESIGAFHAKVYDRAYRIMEEKDNVKLDTLLKRQRNRMKRDGVCKTRVNNFKKIDLIKQNRSLFSCFERALSDIQKKVS